MATINDATKAYGAVLNQAQKAAGVPDASSNLPSFGEVLKNAAQSAIEAQHTSEKVSAAGLMGKADITEVMQAVTEAEMALNMVLSVRDRVISAYETVMRTPI